MTRLQTAPHGVVRGATVVEVHHPNFGLIGVIYPTENGVRIVSKYLDANNVAMAIFNTDPSGANTLEVLIV